MRTRQRDCGCGAGTADDLHFSDGLIRMIDMLTMWFWAWYIGTVLGAAITLVTFIYLIVLLFSTSQKEKK
jgi:hypothetical protein